MARTAQSVGFGCATLVSLVDRRFERLGIGQALERTSTSSMSGCSRTTRLRGVELSRRAGEPWVADLGDPWALDEMMVYPTALHRRRDLAPHGKVAGTASAIVMSTPEAVRRLRGLPGAGRSSPLVAIPNGFAADDFDGPAPVRTTTARFASPIRVTCTPSSGYRSSALASSGAGFLKGSVSGLDILTRTHIHLIEAVNRLLAAEPALRDVIEAHLALAR